MMQLKEFAEQVLAIVRDKADGDFNVWIITISKNNGTVFTGITTSGDGKQPVIYLDGYYNRFIHNQINAAEVADIVYEVIMEQMNYVPDIKLTDLMDWEQMKLKICVKLINAEKNKELLWDAPHRFFLDFAIVYYIRISEDENVLQSIDVRNKHLELWGVSENDLYRVGLKNLEDTTSVLFKNMCDILPLWMQKPEEPRIPMYVLSNSSRMYGASVLLIENVLKEISQSLGDLIILPSSLHDLIVLPQDQHEKVLKTFLEMVKYVNENDVPPEDYLSDHVYVYDSEKLELRIAA